MHELGYVYGPKESAELAEVLAAYDEQAEEVLFERVMLTNVPLTLETSLLELITKLNKFSGRWGTTSGIALVDDVKNYVDERTLMREGFFLVSYNLDTEVVTANVLMSKAIWDWYVIGGRWPCEFKVKPHIEAPDVIEGYHLSWAVDQKAMPDMAEYRRSVEMGWVDWKAMEREHVAYCLKSWEMAQKFLPDQKPRYKVYQENNRQTNLPTWKFDFAEYDTWRSEVQTGIQGKLSPEDHMGMTFDIYDVAGLTRREAIRYALARCYVPNVGIFSLSSDHKTEVFYLGWGAVVTPDEVKAIIRYVRKNLTPDVVVTAVDFHN